MKSFIMVCSTLSFLNGQIRTTGERESAEKRSVTLCMSDTSCHLISTISAFGLGEQVENEGPQLDATEIARQLLKLLEFPEVYKHRIQYWQNRARESLGPDGGAAVILSEAGKQADRYKEVYSFPGRLKTRFNMEPSEGFL